jgi:hypothetical protein
VERARQRAASLPARGEHQGLFRTAFPAVREGSATSASIARRRPA